MKITDIKNLPQDVTSENYENIFNVYTDENAFYYFNLLKKVDFPDDLNSDIYDWYQTQPIDTYPNISYRFYKSVTLWWIICAANHIDDPTKQPEAGVLLKIIKPFYIKNILARINQNE